MFLKLMAVLVARHVIVLRLSGPRRRLGLQQRRAKPAAVVFSGKLS
jgi:hypothetical protein